jgi:mono/diheme cytochrome c family protein
MRTLLRLILIPIAIGAIVLAVASMFIKGKGFSTRDEPSRIETVVAMQFRKLAMPSEARDRKNTVAASPEAIEAGLAHWADHCATCHANDGSGDTTIGRNLYPKAPDMRKAPTQDLTDGELFYIIEHGVRLTGMPAWGTDPPTPEGDKLGWQLVHFIRRLPKLTPEEIARMEELNPKTPDEWRTQQEEKDFLEGRDAPSGGEKPKPHAASPHKHE